MKQQQDVLVVGSGPVGIVVARRLAERGLRVTVLEAGTAITTPPGSHFRNQPRIRENPDGYFAAIAPYLKPVSDPAKQADLPGAFESALVGGWGVLWTNNCPRVTEFERWEAMTPHEWEHWYTEAEDMLRVVPAPTANSRTGTNIRARLQRILAHEGRTLCDLPFSGRVLPSGDFYYNGPWDFLEAATPEVRSRISIRSGVWVNRLRLEESRVTGVDVEVAGKKSVALNASAVFLAGGATGIPRLLHRSGIRPAALGRGISFHALLFGQMILDPDLCPSADATDIAPRLWIPPETESPWHLMLLRDTCPFPPAEEIENPHRLLEVQGFLSMEFQDENAIVIDEKEELEFRFTLSNVDRERMRAMESDVQCLLGHLGRWRRGCESAWLPFDNAHMAGTCRMDRPDWEGVSNSSGKVHGFENLYLTSVGLFPVPVAENPTLTAVALALRTCDQFVT